MSLYEAPAKKLAPPINSCFEPLCIYIDQGWQFGKGFYLADNSED